MTSEITVEVGGSAMPILLALAAGTGPHPAILVTHHRDGLDTFTKGVVERLAANGFTAAAPGFYHRRPAGEDTKLSRQSLRDVQVVADIDATVAKLKSMPEVRGDAIGIMGHCAGGRMAYLGAGSNPAFKAAVVLYGGRIQLAEGEGRPSPLELTKNISGPVMGLFGREDTNPSPADVARISAELTRHDIRHDFRIYDGAGHAFQNFDNPETYRHEASEDAWTRLLAFLHAELK